jgi:hypothetical protein
MAMIWLKGGWEKERREGEREAAGRTAYLREAGGRVMRDTSSSTTGRGRHDGPGPVQSDRFSYKVSANKGENNGGKKRWKAGHEFNVYFGW